MMKLQLDPVRQHTIEVLSPSGHTNVYINKTNGDGIDINLIGGVKAAPEFNKIRVIEDCYGLVVVQVYSGGSVIPEINNNEKIIWCNY